MNDSIDRQMAVDSIKNAGRIGKLTCIDILKRLPSAQPEQQWIPCSERLPELDDEVLVTDDYDCIRHCIFCKRGETWRGFVTYEEGMTIDAIAWQPLPSPYREEADQ